MNVDDCWAVGAKDGPVVIRQDVLFLHYTGSNWASVSSPNPNPAEFTGGLNGVECLSAGNCWAVGNSGSLVPEDNVTHSLIEHYTGSRWVIVDEPDPNPGPLTRLNGVTCASDGECWAVGSRGLGAPLSNTSTGARRLSVRSTSGEKPWV